uniref:Uncharacterized protein n=1 Tax=Burkholderia sp. M701 TaxID=326454 RepID=V5YMJ9_9BURK|nr:hypothetical protein [Burkholderia sp. M701]
MAIRSHQFCFPPGEPSINPHNSGLFLMRHESWRKHRYFVEWKGGACQQAARRCQLCILPNPTDRTGFPKDQITRLRLLVSYALSPRNKQTGGEQTSIQIV